jgi:hypothetical protein
VGSRRECTRLLGLDGYRVERLEWEAEGAQARVRIWIESRGGRGYACSGCRRRTWQVGIPRNGPGTTCRGRRTRSRWSIGSAGCGVGPAAFAPSRWGFAEGHARLTRRLRQLIGVDCQSMPTSHAAVRHAVSWSKARRAETIVSCGRQDPGRWPKVGRRSTDARRASRRGSHRFARDPQELVLTIVTSALQYREPSE